MHSTSAKLFNTILGYITTSYFKQIKIVLKKYIKINIIYYQGILFFLQNKIEQSICTVYNISTKRYILLINTDCNGVGWTLRKFYLKKYLLQMNCKMNCARGLISCFSYSTRASILGRYPLMWPSLHLNAKHYCWMLLKP